MVAFSGFYESHEPPPLGDARGIAPLHRNGHRKNGQQSGYMFIMIVALVATGAIRSE
jgi:hypothetical protein